MKRPAIEVLKSMPLNSRPMTASELERATGMGHSEFDRHIRQAVLDGDVIELVVNPTRRELQGGVRDFGGIRYYMLPFRHLDDVR